MPINYTYQKIEGQENLYQVTYDNNGDELVFSVGAVTEDQIPELVQLQLDFINNTLVPEITYAVKRANEYPTIPNQLDTLYHGGYDAWKAEIQAVKDKYPKPV